MQVQLASGGGSIGLYLELASWDELKEYIERFTDMMEIGYQLRQNRSLRVVAGRFACEIKTTEREADQVLEYLKDRGAREIVGVVDETFFSAR
ncbi:MAG: hypothetical protein JRN08_09180 [Nitrososphaerota archaeon]|nr:hypothetical protein [Nitrososphaerota archaeon]